MPLNYKKKENRKIYTKKAFDEVYNSENSFAKTYGLHREYLEFEKSEYIELKKYAKKLNIIFFATQLSILIVLNFLNDIDLPAFKIASADILNFPLIEHVATFNKPMILSTGFSDLKQIEKVYKILTKKKKLIFHFYNVQQLTHVSLRI